MRFALAILLCLLPGLAHAENPACWLQDAKGDKFTFTATNWVWIYKPKGGSAEACTYGADPDTGAHTVTCPAHKIDAIVYGRSGGASILNREWTRQCKPDAGL